MKIVVYTLLLCGLPPVNAASRPSSPPMTAEQSIRAIYARQDAAIARKDEPGVLLGCAPDYKEVHTEPKVHGMSFTIAALRPMIHSMMYYAKTASRKTTIKEITFGSDGVTVTIRQKLDLWMPVPKKHRYGHVITVSTSEDTWVKGKHGWQDKQSLVISGQTAVYLHKMPVSRKPQKHVQAAKPRS